MTETFHQQQSTLTARLQEQGQRRLDDFRREVEVTALQARTTRSAEFWISDVRNKGNIVQQAR